MKRNWICGILMLTASILVSGTVFADEAEPAYSRIEVLSENYGFGQEAEQITITVENTEPYSGLAADDYLLSGCVIHKRTGEEIEMAPSSVEYTDTEIILTVDPFIITSSHRHFAFTCTDSSLNFGFDDISEIAQEESKTIMWLRKC